MKKIALIITFIALITSNLYAFRCTANDSIILYSIEKTIENTFLRRPEYLKNSKSIYWVKVTDVDLNKNEWRFAYIETDRRKTFIVKDFKTDTIIDYGHSLLFVSYNDIIFKNKESNNIIIDSLVFSEESMLDPYYVGGIIIHANYCRIKYSCGGKYKLFGQTVPYKLPLSLSRFTLQALHVSHKYAETEEWVYIYSEQDEKTKAKLDIIIEDANSKRLKQEEFINKLVKNCDMIWVNTWKRKFK